MKLFPWTVIGLALGVSGCSTLWQTAAKEDDCSYMVIRNPRGQMVARLGELHQQECHPIQAHLVETADFVATYKFVRLIQTQYPPTLTLVVKPKGGSLAKPVLIKSGGARDRVFTSVDHTVDYTGESHRFVFGRFAAESFQGLEESDWAYHLVLSLEPAGS